MFGWVFELRVCRKRLQNKVSRMLEISKMAKVRKVSRIMKISKTAKI